MRKSSIGMLTDGAPSSFELSPRGKFVSIGSYSPSRRNFTKSSALNDNSHCFFSGRKRLCVISVSYCTTSIRSERCIFKKLPIRGFRKKKKRAAATGSVGSQKRKEQELVQTMQIMECV